MSGHSKWATIKHKKGAADAKRGKMFSKLSKELMLVARAGGSDPSTNAALRNVLQRAKSINMPSDNIDRAVKKGAGELEGVVFEEVTYEGYASGGIGLVVNVLTDNKNRAAAEIRHTFGRHGTNFAAQGAVTRGFERKGQIFVNCSVVDEDKLMGIVLDAGADDMKSDGEQYEILTGPGTMTDVTIALEKAGIAMISAEVALVPTTLVPVSEKNVVQSVLKFVADLEDHDDVQNVYHNMDVPDEIMKELEE